jgi:hypothetical protein
LKACLVTSKRELRTSRRLGKKRSDSCHTAMAQHEWEAAVAVRWGTARSGGKADGRDGAAEEVGVANRENRCVFRRPPP